MDKDILLRASSASPVLSDEYLQLAKRAIHSDDAWTQMEGCYALMRHSRDCFEDAFVRVLEDLFLRGEPSVPIRGNLLVALRDASRTEFSRFPILASLVFQSARSEERDLRVNAAILVKELAEDNYPGARELLDSLSRDSDEAVRRNCSS